VYGAGGFGREVAWLITEIKEQERFAWDLVGFIDDNPRLKNSSVNGFPVLGGLEALRELPGICLALALGMPSVRKRVLERLAGYDVQFPNLIHPTVLMGPDVSLGVGNILCAGVIVTVNVRIGNFCHLNLKTTVGHDCDVEDFATAACGVDLAGYAHVQEGAYLGNHATVLPSVRVGAWSVIGAGAVVNRDVGAGSVCAGVPARLVRKNPALQTAGGAA
jgi:sugar O-acyltransferase (sialic acid O-acetyltransferase NeuD family)